MKELTFSSEFFTLFEVADGIFAAIEIPDHGTGSNAGFIDLGETTIVVDTFLNANAAQDLRKAAIEFTGKEPKFVITTHFHLDHVIGNCAFAPEAQFITSETANELIKTETQKRFDEIKNTPLEEVEKLKKQLKTEMDPQVLKNVKNDLNFIQNVKDPKVTLRSSSITFTDELSLFGSKNSVLLKTYPVGHSKGDVIVYIPKAKVIFTGDLLFMDRHPWIGSGDPIELVKVLENLLEMDIDIAIGGHSKIGDKDGIDRQRQYVIELVKIVQNKIDSENDNLKVSLSDLPKPFNQWEGATFQWNVDFLFKYLRKDN